MVDPSSFCWALGLHYFINGFFSTEGGVEKENIKFKLLLKIDNNIRLNHVILLMSDHLLPAKIEIYYGLINIWGIRNSGDKYQN